MPGACYRDNSCPVARCYGDLKGCIAVGGHDRGEKLNGDSGQAGNVDTPAGRLLSLIHVMSKPFPVPGNGWPRRLFMAPYGFFCEVPIKMPRKIGVPLSWWRIAKPIWPIQ